MPTNSRLLDQDPPAGSAPVNDSIELLPLYCPFPPAAPHAELDAVVDVCRDWLGRFGLYQSTEQRERILGGGAAELFSRTLPDADVERIAVCAKWLYWGFAIDDLCADLGPMSVDTAAFVNQAALWMRIIEEPRSRFTHEPLFADALRDVVTTFRRLATPAQITDFVHTARSGFFGLSWDTSNATRRTVPSISEYLAMRQHTGGSGSMLTCLTIATRLDPPARESSSPKFRAYVETLSTVGQLINDLASYRKEHLNGEGAGNNIITVVAAAKNRAVDQRAVAESYVIFERIAALCVRLREELLDTAGPELRGYIAVLDRTWPAIVEWSFTSPRYNRADGLIGGDLLQTRPAVTDTLACASLNPLPYPAVAWWWDEIGT